MSSKTLIIRKLKNVDEKICLLFDEIETHDRLWVSDMVIQFLRTFLEHVSALIYADDHPDEEVIIGKDRIAKYTLYLEKINGYSYIKKMHESLNKSVSHFVPEEDGAERLMIGYYSSLLKIKKMIKERFNIDLLYNLNKFPTDLDKTLDNYYSAIYEELNNIDYLDIDYDEMRYYVMKSHPVIVNNDVFYEITLKVAKGNVKKADNFIVFSKYDIETNYSIKIDLCKTYVDVDDFKMPISIIKSYNVSIRPCELDKVALLCGNSIKMRSSDKLYQSLMEYLIRTRETLLDIILKNDNDFNRVVNELSLNVNEGLYDTLVELRRITLNNYPGTNIVRYLLSYLRNDVINDQLIEQPNQRLSNLYITYKSIPFDDMPIATSLYKHVIPKNEIIKCVDIDNREHEFLAEKVNNAAYNNNIMYFEFDKEYCDYYEELVKIFNGKLYSKGKQIERKISIFNNFLYVEYLENNTKDIMEVLKSIAKERIDNYEQDMIDWINDHPEIDDDSKKEILKKLFINSKVALIYGAAGTGKTKIIEYVTEFFSDANILLLSSTNASVENLKRRTNFKFNYKTIYNYVHQNDYIIYDLIVIDECSTISNEDIYEILHKKHFDKLLLVGDIYQIESIKFGNWFDFASHLLKKSVHELQVPYRAKDNTNLLEVWKEVRKRSEQMFLKMQSFGYIEDISDDIFKKNSKNEIILCLGYNGLYGINNLNRFLQGNNHSDPVEWGVWTYKVGDPILFVESERFGQYLYNNLTGEIINIMKYNDRIVFWIEIDIKYTADDLRYTEITLIRNSENKSTVSITVYKDVETDDDQNDNNTIVPFQIAYAVSIHKAQGLEYDSVKVIITKDVEERISHSIFYTAITRAKKNLKVYMSAETQRVLLEKFIEEKRNMRQFSIFKSHTKIK